MHVRMCIINPYVYDSTPSRIHERRIVRACTCSRAARIIHDAPSYALVRSLVSLSLPPSPSLFPSHARSLFFTTLSAFTSTSIVASTASCFIPLLPSTPSQRAFFNPSRGTCSRADRINLPCFYEQFLRSHNRSNSSRKITTIRIPRFRYSFLFV